MITDKPIQELVEAIKGNNISNFLSVLKNNAIPNITETITVYINTDGIRTHNTQTIATNLLNLVLMNLSKNILISDISFKSRQRMVNSLLDYGFSIDNVEKDYFQRFFTCIANNKPQLSLINDNAILISTFDSMYNNYRSIMSEAVANNNRYLVGKLIDLGWNLKNNCATIRDYYGRDTEMNTVDLAIELNKENIINYLLFANYANKDVGYISDRINQSNNKVLIDKLPKKISDFERITINNGLKGSQFNQPGNSGNKQSKYKI